MGCHICGAGFVYIHAFGHRGLCPTCERETQNSAFMSEEDLRDSVTRLAAKNPQWLNRSKETNADQTSE